MRLGRPRLRLVLLLESGLPIQTGSSSISFPEKMRLPPLIAFEATPRLENRVRLPSNSPNPSADFRSSRYLRGYTARLRSESFCRHCPAANSSPPVPSRCLRPADRSTLPAFPPATRWDCEIRNHAD